MSGLVLEIAEKVEGAGGRALLVGGFVRDKLLGLESKDFDVEVYGIELEELKKLLSELGEVNEVGESFAVLKVNGIDVSLPRKDIKTGAGHTGFDVEYDSELSFEEASRRRDFTVNALGLDPLTDEILDPRGGQKDLEGKILRAVDAHTFGEDPLRVLRATQLAARFEFEIEEETQELCRKLDLNELSAERVGEEWKKLLLKAERPSVGLKYAKKLMIIDKLHPELIPLFDTPQDKKWHPEGSVWEHTKLSVDAAARIIRREQSEPDTALAIMLAVLLHDVGKPATTTKDPDGRIRSRGHTKAGLPLAKSFMKQLVTPRSIQKLVLALIKEHMFLTSLANSRQEITDRAVRRLAARLEPASIRQLALVIEADRSGTGRKFKEGLEKLLTAADKLKVRESGPVPLVTGDDLLKAGYEEGPELGETLDQLYEAQLDGKFDTKEEGIKYLKQEHGSK